MEATISAGFLQLVRDANSKGWHSHPESQKIPRRSFLGIGVSDVDHATVIRFIIRVARSGGRALVNNVNAHALNISHRHSGFFSILNQSDIVFCDGFGVKALARLAGIRLGERMTPLHWIDDLFRCCVEEQIPVYFLGDTNEVLHRFSDEVRRRHGQIKLAGHHHGYFDVEGEANHRLIIKINESGAGIVLVGMGMPRQELWAFEAIPHLDRGVILSVGALFRMYTGIEKPCPELLSRSGLEWLWRLAHQPVRLAGRYLLGNPALILRTLYAAFAKRLIDLLLAGLTVILLLPVGALIYAVLHFETRGAALFRQERVGKDGRRIWIRKFRTLKGDFPPYASKGNITRQSTTRFGRILRRLALDELPQLLNVFRGDMAFVGPRPEMPFIADTYRGIEKLRLSVKPGLTGPWQIARLRGEIAGREIHEDIAYDLDYIRQMGFFYDMRILAKTAFYLAAVPFGILRNKQKR
jgi:exopolysaccharide biosynthesis WecB/TagA/CpsF family protein